MYQFLKHKHACFGCNDLNYDHDLLRRLPMCKITDFHEEISFLRHFYFKKL